MQDVARRLGVARSWPWLLLVMTTLPAFWHVLVFPNDVDQEFPTVNRPTYSRYPPPAYRLAEPGDTIDRVQIYVSSIALVLSITGLLRDRRRLQWLATLALSFAAFWQAANPGPTFDGWHGLGFRAILDPTAPPALRFALVGLAVALAFVVHRGLARSPGLGREIVETGWFPFLTVSALLYVVGWSGLVDFEPLGYWPRWCMVWGLIGLTSLLLITVSRLGWRPRLVVRFGLVGPVVWYLLVYAGIGLTWYHRPLSRLREIVPGKILISAMPTERGLEVAQARHHFKTIIDLFPEDGALRSPYASEEARFVRRHGLNFLGSTSDPSTADAFLDQTLAIAQDPDAWPILIHCHGCMDRTPAWVGIYEFVVQGKPLVESFRFIERHRGYRPKASVTLLYNRVLSRLAPQRVVGDPLATKLGDYANGLKLAFPKASNPEVATSVGVGSRPGPSASSTLPSLTPRR